MKIGNEWTSFTDGEMKTIEVCLELSMDMWKFWLVKGELPDGWTPDRAELMISNIEGVMKKFEGFKLFDDLYNKESEE